MSFKKFLKDIQEETGVGDIASVDNKLGMTKRQKHLDKGKKCKKHKVLNCETCEMEEDSKYN
jgi:hypothetical protein